jgi:hypothetical protein
MSISGPGRVVGNSRIREIQAEARGEWLREGAQFSTEMQKLPAVFRFPRGVVADDSGFARVRTLDDLKRVIDSPLRPC